MTDIRLTQFSPGAGCGCKISPSDLEDILKISGKSFKDEKLLVGYETKDDAAVYDLGEDKALISTTDFFTPIVDDPFLFGKIAATNAMSDVYAMGGKPLMAISILGWPLDKLSKETASEVVKGAISACTLANIAIAGGHSIDIPVPIFGLAVSGIVSKMNIKRNNSAIDGHHIFLTKPLGVGIMSTAAKKGIIRQKDLDQSISEMCKLNSIGTELGNYSGVSAMTDVTGFGLLGHLLEMCEGSHLKAELEFRNIPILEGIADYIDQEAIPGGTFRNLKSLHGKIGSMTEQQKLILADPQTSGGLLFSVEEEEISRLQEIALKTGVEMFDIGKFSIKKQNDFFIEIK